MRYSGLRTLAQLAAGRPPGPEASVAKLFWSEYHKRLGEIAMGIEGADGLLRPDGDGYPVSSWQSVFLGSRAGTIYSGTGFAGPLTAVHPRARTAFGLPVVPSLRDLPEPADLAFVLAPVQAVEGVLDDMGAAGIPNAVVLASGYREVGENGRTRQEALVARAIANGVTVLGPNCLGFVNAHTRRHPTR